MHHPAAAGSGAPPRRGGWRCAAWARFAAAVLALVLCGGAGAAVAQDEEDNELDRFMERVLERRAHNAAARLQYVLDERSRLRIDGPDGAALWSFRGEYTWYERDGFFVRSPVRIDGVRIGEADRRRYEADWLEQERRRSRQRAEERRSPTRRSSRSTRDNVAIAVERLWGAPVEGGLLDAIAGQARARGDDHAAIVAAADRILEALGGVSAVGFGRTVKRARDGFAMLESGRLSPDETAGTVGRMLGPLASAAPAASDAEFAGFLELFDLSLRFELALEPPEESAAGAPVDPALSASRAAALADRRRALAAASAERAGRDEPNPAVAWGAVEPRFLADAYYFLDFEFEPGNYYFAGRETLNGADVLRIEYYPQRLFSEDRGDAAGGERPEDERDGEDERRDEIEAAMSRTILVTLWIEPRQHQVVRYTFDNLGFDFLPGRWLARVDDVTASMTMGQPFPGVWLPARMQMRGRVSLATGAYEATFERTYDNYREAETGGRVRAVAGADPVTPDAPR